MQTECGAYAHCVEQSWQCISEHFDERLMYVMQALLEKISLGCVRWGVIKTHVSRSVFGGDMDLLNAACTSIVPTTMRGREVHPGDLHKRLYRFIERTGIDAPVVRTRENTPCAQTAAFEIGISISQVVEVRVFRIKSDRVGPDENECATSYVVAIAPCGRCIDKVRLSGICGVAKLRMAKPQEVWRLTGCIPGAVAAVGFPQDTAVVLDAEILGYSLVVCAAGRADLFMFLRPAEIVRLCRAMVHAIT